MSEPRPISIWAPVREKSGGISFVRPEPSPLGDHFADAPVLRPKRSELPLRVILFGESAAAGYLYAPAVTLAKILGSTLEAAAPNLTEVIDLARTNETLLGLAETVEAAIQIQPDVLVLFAGNNWNLLETPELSAAAPSAAARVRFGELLALGTGQPVAEARRQIAERANATLDRIAALGRAIGIPVVVVIPEVNLDDWENIQPAAGLDAETTMRWHRLLGEGRAALDGGDARTAALSARALLRIDGGLCPSGYRLLGRALQKLGRIDEAASAFRAEIDAAAYPLLANLGVPQATSQTAEILNAAADRHGWLRVDLRALFAAISGSPLPGRRFFLDYCHLTSEGLRIAAAAIAQEVLPFLGDPVEPAPSWRELLDRAGGLEIPSEVEATARLGAAIHGAHRLLPLREKSSFLEPFLAEALALSPHAEGALRDLIDARTAPLPAVATAAQRRNLDSPCRLGLPHGWRWDYLDAEVLRAAQTVLSEHHPAAVLDLERRLIARAIGPEWTELARAPWVWEPLEQFFADLLDYEDLARRAFLRSPWPETGFALIASGQEDLEIRAVLRCPGAAASGAVVGVGYSDARGSRCESIPLGELAVGRSWSRAILHVPRRMLSRGLARLTLAWPPLGTGGESPMDVLKSRLALGLEADLHPVFGEISSLRIRTVPNCEARTTAPEEGSSPS
ncbi:MAG TPA: hypothetical protein VN851_25390 [Thermoanaerobaculia bacterium]|nr:hypothetical protein [Thermoanaerobaculia bacterium]